jgi:hypothetical protein
MSNLYLWKDPKGYPEKYIGTYQYNSDHEWGVFFQGKTLFAEDVSFTPTVTFEVPKENIQKYDGLPYSGTGFLVNEKIRDLLFSLAPNDVQWFPARVICTDGALNGYGILNITHMMRGINHDESIYSLLDLPGGAKMISIIRKLVFKEGCLEDHGLARDVELRSHLIVSQQIYDAFKSAKIKGVRLVTPDEYYEGLNALYRRG